MAIAPHSSLSPLASGSGSGSHSGAKPKSDWSNTYFPPPPNRLEELEVSREASLGRKIEGAAIAEELVLSWLRHQAQDTLPSQINLAELNRATRILYRLTAIQKTLMSLHAEITDWREKKNPTPPDNTPDDPELARELADDSEDSDNDPPSATPLGARTSPSANATVNQPPSASTQNAPPLGARTPSSATPPTSSSPQFPSPDAPPPAPDTEPLSVDNSHSSPTSHASHASHSSHIPQSAISNPQSDIPHSAFPISHSSPRCASVHACPTLSHLNEDYFDQTLAMVTRLTGKPVHVVASSSDCESEPPAAQSPSPSQSPAQSDFADQSVRSVGSVGSVQFVPSALPQSEIPNPQSNNPQSDAPSVNPVNLVHPVHPVHPVHDGPLTHAHPVRTTLPHGPPRNQF